MLDESVDGDCEEAGPKAEGGKKDGGADEADMHRAEKDAGERHANGAEGNKAVLDFVAAEEAGDHAADADSDSECCIEIAGFGLANVEDVGSVDYNRGKEKGAEKPEVGIAKN